MAPKRLSVSTMKFGRLAAIAAFVFCSGACALIYQSVWLREFRLVFGASTAASAAVLGIFMGGLGVGSWLLGRRIEKVANPLAFYAKLEILIAGSASLTPFFLMAVRYLYLQTGGQVSMGLWGATAVRLVLSALVLAAPTILMGGTLPALAREVESGRDPLRRRLALLYGVNTIGAVAGVLISTFVLFENLGQRNTLWFAAGLNVIAGVFALNLSRTRSEPERAAEEYVPEPSTQDAAPSISRKFVFAAAGLVGFIYFLMEIVWYRVLSPLLGGSTFTFGMILAWALLGIGIGGLVYSFAGRRIRKGLPAFGLMCAAEALAFILPFALGDRIAEWTLVLRTFGSLGFFMQICGWSVICGIVVLPASIIAGIQFPFLIALLGDGGKSVGRDTGHAYAANTLGAILGSLAGGFGLLPLLGAAGVWRGAVGLTIALSALSLARKGERRAVLAGAGILVLAAAGIFAEGPTGAWRHSGIGAGRADAGTLKNRADWTQWRNLEAGTVEWQTDGVESSVAVDARNSYCFIVNGKSDGSSLGDAGTQVMCGLLGTLIHSGEVKDALVVGLGTGSSAGWLGAVPSIDNVDVVELEPAILRVAKDCTPVNQDVLGNPKVHIHLGDAREHLQVTPKKYDLIFSEPSNPYRAGIASLFTSEYYREAKRRLNPNGLFLQWLQAYEVDDEAISLVYGTFHDVFPNVETWITCRGDLLLIGSEQPMAYDVGKLRERITREPFKSALAKVWNVDSVEGLFARYIASGKLAEAFSKASDLRNTDDSPLLEFLFARSVGSRSQFSPARFFKFVSDRRYNAPLFVNGTLSMDLVRANAFSIIDSSLASATMNGGGQPTAEERARVDVISTIQSRNFEAALGAYRKAPFEPCNIVELRALTTMFAVAGTESEAEKWIDRLAAKLPSEKPIPQSIRLVAQHKTSEATDLMIKVFTAHRTDPWLPADSVAYLLQSSASVTRDSPENTRKLFDVLTQCFAVKAQELLRKNVLMNLASSLTGEERTSRVTGVLETFEPWPIWSEQFLSLRNRIYTAANHPLAERAQSDLLEFAESIGWRMDVAMPATGKTKVPSAPSETLVPDHMISGPKEPVSLQDRS